MKKRILLLGALVILGGIIAWVAIRRDRRQVFLLPDGRKLSLGAVGYGTNDIYFPGGLFEKLKYKLLPDKGTTVFGRKFQPLRPKRTSRRDTNTLVCWNKVWSTNDPSANRAERLRGYYDPASRELMDLTSNPYRDLRAVIVDETGFEWEMKPGGYDFEDYRVPDELDGISSLRFVAFPRRQKKFPMRIYRRNASNRWDMLAEFQVKNPVPGPYPKWTPEDLPVTRKSGDLEVTLLSLTTGTKIVNYLSEEPRPFTTALFEVRRNGAITTNWVPTEFDAIDATGNRDDFPIVNWGSTNEVVYYFGQATSLSPSETWKLTVAFSRTSDFAPDETWQIHDIPVEHGRIDLTSVSTNLLGIDLSLELADKKLRMSKVPENEGVRMTLDIKSEQGEEVRRQNGLGRGEYIEWDLLPDSATESIDVWITLTRSRFFEFLAQPTLLEGYQPLSSQTSDSQESFPKKQSVAR